jgi:hypothetical protein
MSRVRFGRVRSVLYVPTIHYVLPTLQKFNSQKCCENRAGPKRNKFIVVVLLVFFTKEDEVPDHEEKIIMHSFPLSKD